MKNGIDISYCQAGLDLKQAKKEGVEFVIIRAGISTRPDTEFTTHIKNAVKEELPYGFYWYSRAFSTLEARSEAEACIKAIKGCSPTYPIFYDMEEKDQIDGLTNEQRTDIICVFCEEIRKAGYTAGVYINPSWMENYIDKSRLIGNYEIWLAHWTNSPDIATKYDYGQVMWQWGLCKISSMNVDADVCYKDYIPMGNKEEIDNMLPLGITARFSGGKQYQASQGKMPFDAKPGLVKITNRAKGALHPYHVISVDDSSVYGWVDADSLSEYKADPSKEELEKIALDVIAGQWGNGEERVKALTAAGYDYDTVQKIVNDMIAAV